MALLTTGNKQLTRSRLKKRILVKYRGGAKLQPAGMLRYFEELKRGTHKEIGPKDFFEIASANKFLLEVSNAVE